MKNRLHPLIVAELGASHHGSFDVAKQLIIEAAQAGADAIKLQTWTAGTMCVDPHYIIEHGAWEGCLLTELYEQAYLPWEWHEELFDLARQYNMIPFSTAFDIPSVDFLETLGVDRHKVASFELTDIPLIEYMASKGKPMILSTGMATRDKITRAVAATSCTRPNTITLLKCTSAYPAMPSDADLLAMPNAWDINCSYGLSDHSKGFGVAVAATTLGACYIEKHITLSRDNGGLDDGFALEPDEFKTMATACREAADAVYSDHDRPPPSESIELRRSLYVITNAKMGDTISLDNVGTARPAKGMEPRLLNTLLGKKFSCDVERGMPLEYDLIA